MNIVILRPLVNEKSMSLTKMGLYTFEVGRDATKAQIGKLIHNKYSVDVLRVSTINVLAKKKQQRSRRGYYFSGGMKKAIVKVKKGQKIALFESAVAESPSTGAQDGVEVKTGETKEAEVKEKKSLFKGTKVRIESSGKSLESRKTEDKEARDIKTDAKRPTKVSQKEAKKG